MAPVGRRCNPNRARQADSGFGIRWMRSDHGAHYEADSRADADPHRIAGQGENNSTDTCTEHES